jgi:lysyl-tRNA synthetase class 2
VPRLLGALTYLIGFLDILTGTLHTWRVRLHQVTALLPGGLTDAAAAATVVSGILLILLAHSLRRRKRRAWRAAVVLLALSVGFHILHGHGLRHEPLALLVSVVGLVLLLVYRREFYALGDPSTRLRAGWAFVVLLPASLAVGALTLWANSHAIIGGWPGLGAATWYVLQGMVGIEGSLAFVGAHHRLEDVIGALTFGLGLMTALTTAYLALRSPRRRAVLSDDDDVRVRHLLAEYPDSLGYFTTRRDKAVIWSESGKAGIGYRVVAGVMLAAGDPIGDPEAWPGAIKAFLTEADLHGWTPAVLGCSEQAGTAWTRETGFSALELGDEAIVDATEFSLQGRPMRNVRQMVNRIRRQGYETEVFRAGEAPPEQRDQAVADAAAWRGSGTERGFSMASGRVIDEADPEAVIVTASKDGVVRGFLQFVPWGADGMSLDVMRRDRDADPGVNELLIVDALTRAPELGITRVSLNFAMFRSALERGERLGAGPVLRAWRSVLVFVSRWFQIESLYRFNAKFQPRWFPRYIVYPSPRSLVRVGLAMGVAEAFIVWPRLRWFGHGT